MLDSVLSFGGTVVAFIVALGILVLAHEWGHYIVAKLSGVWVEKFSIGFGPKLIGFVRNGTDYRIAPIPLGGYVKLYGQDPWEEAEGDAALAKKIAEDPRSFHSKSPPRKIATVLAGPLMNLALCFLIMPVVFMVGRMQPRILDEKPVVIGVAAGSSAESAGLRPGDLILSFDGDKAGTWQELLTLTALHPGEEVGIAFEREGDIRHVTARVASENPSEGGRLGIEPFDFLANDPLVDGVMPDSPAEKAGFIAGDLVTEIDGKPVRFWSDMTAMVQASAGSALAFTVSRGDAETELKVAPELSKDSGTWLIGVTKAINPDLFVKKRHGPLSAAVLGTQENLKLFRLTLEVLKRLFTGDLSYKSLGGPIQIAKATSTAAKSGPGEFLYLLAFLSLQLGILNLFPIPVLDGGHVALMAIESLRRKPLSPRVRQISTQVGLAMLLGLMFVVTMNDIDAVIGFANIWRSVVGMF